ncbi:MAG: FAD-dependent oxidoreductase [Ignavibacteria bacterium]|nr:FAD-dependent oxidoreductase [Ignavibacteria bacterium]
MIPERRIIIIGGNAAGAAAAAKAKRTSPSAEVIMFEKSPFISTGTCELPYLISGEIPDYNKIVFFNEETFYSSKQVKVFCNTEVLSIHPGKRTIQVRNNISGTTTGYTYSKLIISTGSRARFPQELDDSLENVFSLKNVTDFLRWESYSQEYNPRKVLVVGAGVLGLEISEALKKSGREVLIYEKSPEPLSGSEPEIGKLIHELIVRNGVEYFTSILPPQYIRTQNKISHIKIDGRLIEIDAIFVATGFIPEITLVQQAGLTIGKNGGIVVSTKMQTSNSDIYACGDCIELKELITGQSAPIFLATIAKKTAQIAAENSAGGNKYLRPIVKNISLKLFNQVITQCGATAEQLKDKKFKIDIVSSVLPNLVPVMPGAGTVYGKIVYNKHDLLIQGACFFGQAETVAYSDIISVMIQNKIPLSELADTNFTYTPAASPFINPLTYLAAKALNNKR